MPKNKPTETTKKGRAPNGQFERGNYFRYEKGTSGNPAGRPPRRRLESIIDEMLRSPSPFRKGLTVLQNIIEAQISLALLGEIDSVKILFERLEGKPYTQAAPTAEDEAKKYLGNNPEEIDLPEPGTLTAELEEQA